MVIFRRKLLVTIFCLGFFKVLPGQQSEDTLLRQVDINKYAAQVSEKAQSLSQKLDSKTEKVLNRLQRQEEKIYRKLLSTKDSLAARIKLSECREKYTAVRERISNPLRKGTHYISKLDTLSTSLKFLSGSGAAEKVKDALAKTDLLQNKFQAADEVKKFIHERRQHSLNSLN